MMYYRPLGRTGLSVSLIGLGTMTWGEQNSEREAHEQLDVALTAGVNFVDAAELYPVPPRAQTQGATESIIGSWFAARQNRSKVILASKVAGRSAMAWIRGGKSRLYREQIREALEGSLKRLRTEYIDLYQLHWPDRRTNFFGQLGYVHRDDDDFYPLEEQLETLTRLVESGKIRHIGVSNETPWGVARFLQIAEEKKWPRMASIQNPYSLVNRSFEVGLAEIALREQCGLLAYSPLGFGVLSGKYLDGAKPPAARLTLFGDHFQRYTKPQGVAATRAYVDIARRHGLDPAAMALAYVNTRPFTTSTLIGATTLEQLRANIDSVNLVLPEAVLNEIEAAHAANPYPCP